MDGDGNCAYAAWAKGMLALLAVKGASGFGVRFGLDSFLGTPAGRASLSGMKLEEFDQKRASIKVLPALMATKPLPVIYWYSDRLTPAVAERLGVPCSVFSVTGDSYTCVPRYLSDKTRSEAPLPPLAILFDGDDHYDYFVMDPNEPLSPIRISQWAERRGKRFWSRPPTLGSIRTTSSKWSQAQKPKRGRGARAAPCRRWSRCQLRRRARRHG